MENIENGEEVKEKEHNISDIGQCLIYIEAIPTALIIVGMIMGETSSLEAAEDAILFLANAIAFLVTLVSYIDEHEKNKKKETEKSSKKTSNMSVAGLALAGSSIFLIVNGISIVLKSCCWAYFRLDRYCTFYGCTDINYTFLQQNAERSKSGRTR
ncbi:MAG: hypothetical protein O7167_02175 [Wolbachia endosymbiont of Andrena nigroaenea]|uniref:hypothetical protein n=1 Tax=Wolbachia endosymbiont (group A) of Andrena hattorfiana TaxID=2953977 RepID=UPI0021F88B05|nr:hypothetical protein [Wolbachia endosymbiont (group A) of Andrena hattorfiana]MDX5526677.1 hypothetical protein [Wolbachia endosymbiont of Andrena nigroaenea]